MCQKEVSRILGKRQTIVFFLLTSFMGFSQKEIDTIQAYDEITIRAIHHKIEQHNTLHAEQIEILSAEDLGSLLQHITGLTIKSYGGIGGMKTVANRGMGGEHNQLIIDGMPINDPQSGQINFGAIPSSQIEKISSDFQSQNDLLPVSALIKGSDIQVTTFLQSFSNSPASVRLNAKTGSFGLKKVDFALKNGNEKYFMGFGGGFLLYNGNYPFLLKTDLEKKYRKNNKFQNSHFSFGNGFKWEKKRKNELKINATANFIAQQLPGAVVFYNDLAKETLETKNASAGIQYKLKSQKFALSSFAHYAHRYLGYYDPNFLNIDGFIDNRYQTHSAIGGFHAKRKIKNGHFHIGNDFTFDKLNSNRNFGNPTRISNTSMLKMDYHFPLFTTEAEIFSQFFLDADIKNKYDKNYNQFHLQLAARTSDELFENAQIFVWYKPSSRAPSFNELYFSQVGNKDLVPEETSQINLGAKYLLVKKRFSASLQGNVFKNLVKNKIVALPTKNMFIWSIQNLGKVAIYGGDFNLKIDHQLLSNWNLKFLAGINYQKALDVTNKNAPSYRHQIAYTPEIQGNSAIDLHYKKAGFHINGIFTGSRYSLNENIPANLLAPFFTFDVSGSYSFIIKQKYKLNCSAGIKNVGNQQEGFVRYFVLPGRNYFIQLNYAFH